MSEKGGVSSMYKNLVFMYNGNPSFREAINEGKEAYLDGEDEFTGVLALFLLFRRSGRTSPFPEACFCLLFSFPLCCEVGCVGFLFFVLNEQGRGIVKDRKVF